MKVTMTEAANILKERNALRTQNAELLAALRQIESWHQYPETQEMLANQPQAAFMTIQTIARSALARAKDGAA